MAYRLLLLLAFLLVSAISFGQKKPLFKGGDEAYGNFLGKNTRFPDEAREEGIMGKVGVKMIINPDGSFDSLYIAYGVHPSLDKEALRVLQLTQGMWLPETVDGKPVRQAYIVPVRFEIWNKDAHNEQYYLAKAEKLEKKGKSEEALENYKMAVKVNYKNEEALYKVATILISSNKGDEACLYLRQIKDVGTKNVDELIAKHCAH
jgi:TonB family protein